MKSILKDAWILFAITAVAGVLLAVVNEVTKEPIARQKEAQVSAACRAVFADAAEFVPETAPAERPEYAAWQSEYPRDTVDEVYSARNAEGEPLGYVLNVTNKEGYGGNIRFSMGIRTDGTLNGVAILETAETPGLGLQAEEVLVPQFADRKPEAQFVLVKGGGAAAENEVDAISSATITTKAFVNGVNAGMAYYHAVYGSAK
ncbi:MAG: RnfABCDGE type electron transport complex subunit G [Lachnospiraceae bacterium]|nr:RnfABCDGE type electron transport complex subunit G [Lachnospiraceae bacterium]